MMTTLTAARQAGTLQVVQDQREPTLDERTEGAFALEMRMARTERKLTQAALAQELELRFGIKLDATAITRMERRGSFRGHENARAIRLGEAVAIAEILELSLNDLLKPDLMMQIKTAAETLRRNRRRAYRIRASVEESEDAYLDLVLLKLSEDGDTDLVGVIHDLQDEASSIEDEIVKLRSKLIRNERKGESRQLFATLVDARARLSQNRTRKRAIISRLTWSPKYDDISGFAPEYEVATFLPHRERMAELATLEFLELSQEVNEADGDD